VHRSQPLQNLSKLVYGEPAADADAPKSPPSGKK